MMKLIKDDRWFAFMSSTKCYNSWEKRTKPFSIPVETYEEWKNSPRAIRIGPEELGGWG